MVGQVVKEKPEEKGEVISQEGSITLVHSKTILTFKFFVASHLYNNTLKMLQFCIIVHYTLFQNTILYLFLNFYTYTY